MDNEDYNHYQECLIANKGKNWNSFDCLCDEISLDHKEEKDNEIAEGDR